MENRSLHLGVREVVLSLTFAGMLAGCTSALKRQCDSTNWFEYGQSVAKRGQRTSTDTFVQQCAAEEAEINHPALSQGFQKGLDEYCTADFAYRLGQQGEFLATDMCSGAAERAMKPRHAEGVIEYCQAENGATVGATGKKYNQICPKNLAKAFLQEFNKGRKKYLASVVTRKEAEIDDLDREIADLDRKRGGVLLQLQTLQHEKVLQHTTSYDPQTGAKTEQVSLQNSQQTNNEIDSFHYQLKNIDQEIAQKRNQQRALRQTIRETHAEILTL